MRGRPAGWLDAVGEYLTAMRAAGRSPGTVRLHRYKLAQFAEGHPSPWRVTRRDLTAWLAADHWQPETRKSARTIVRGFYRWAHGMGYLDVDPAFDLPPVSVPLARPRPTPEHVVRQLIADPDDRLGFMGMLGAFAGLRAGEISRVHGSDLIGDELVVVGKGGTVGVVPILDPRLYRRIQEVGDGWAFPNGYGGHLSSGHVSKLLSRALPGDWTAHTLRHRCATRAYLGTRDIYAVKALLRHARLETTQRYTQMDDAGLRAAVAAAGLPDVRSA